MRNFLKYAVPTLLLVFGTSVLANAKDEHRRDDPRSKEDHSPQTAPEVDPSMAFSGLSLLAGATLVLRSKSPK